MKMSHYSRNMLCLSGLSLKQPLTEGLSQRFENKLIIMKHSSQPRSQRAILRDRMGLILEVLQRCKEALMC